MIDTKKIEYEVFEKQEEVEVPKDEDGNPIPPPEGAKPAFRPSDYKWTKCNKMARNLPQIFMGSKGTNVAVHEVKSAEQYSANSQYEAISKGLDEICAKVVSEPNPSYFQIVFAEDE